MRLIKAQLFTLYRERKPEFGLRATLKIAWKYLFKDPKWTYDFIKTNCWEARPKTHVLFRPKLFLEIKNDGWIARLHEWVYDKLSRGQRCTVDKAIHPQSSILELRRYVNDRTKREYDEFGGATFIRFAGLQFVLNDYDIDDDTCYFVIDRPEGLSWV